MLKVCIVDDERPAITRLQQLLAEQDVEIVGTFTKTSEVIKQLPAIMPDVAFLDIEMPGMSGLELAAELQAKHPHIEIVFVTAFNNYAVEAFHVHAIDYLVKPIDPQRLAKTFARLNAVYAAKRGREYESDNAARKNHQSTKRLTITLFQKFTMTLDGREMTPIRWRTSKAQELFLYLLHQRGQACRKSTLIDMFWPEYEPERALSQLYTSAYHIRKTLADLADYIQVISTKDTYYLKLHDVLLDVEHWESAISDCGRLGEDTADRFAETLHAYTGDYLQEHDYIWAESERHRLKMIWLQHAFQLGEYVATVGRTDQAISLYMQICARYPQSEEAHFALIKLYDETQQHTLIRHQFQQLKKLLAEELHVAPSDYIIDWYNTWLRDHPSR